MILFYWEFIFLLKSFPQCQLFYSQDVREGEQSPLDSTLVDMPELQDDRELMKEDWETAGGVDFFFLFKHEKYVTCIHRSLRCGINRRIAAAGSESSVVNQLLQVLLLPLLL